eukprot:COSAG05_NODE_5828_length_1078_cov_1.981614_1_plen_60_part_10
MGGHRHGSHTMAGVGHNHSFPHMLNLSYREYGISSTCSTAVGIGIPISYKICLDVRLLCP